MYAIIMDYAHRELEAAELDNLCMAPTVFKSYEDGYTLWANHAETLERGNEWKAWSEDEACSQRDAREDRVIDSWNGLFCVESELP